MAANRYGRTAWLVWGVGVFGYALAVMHRAALGVAGLEAAEHFGTTPGIISTFVVLQLATYALAQVPVGLLLDRYGSRLMLTGGTLVIAGGQALLATADDLSTAYVARALLGIGDACMFNSVLRLLPRWFAPIRVPVLSQVTGMVGALGQIAAVGAVLPLIKLLGWQTGLLITVAFSVFAAVLVLAWVRDAPPGQAPAVVVDPIREIPRRIKGVSMHPATQLGF